MRFLSAMIILIGFTSALYAQEQDGQAGLSSFVHQPGFPVEAEMRSKAQIFLEAVRPEDFGQRRKPATELELSQSQREAAQQQ